MARAATRTGRGERRQAAILKAATAVFIDRGFAGATLDDVIARSGGSRATIYAQFGNKEGLFAAIIGELCARMLIPLSDAIQAGRAPLLALTDFAVPFMRTLMTPTSLALYRLVIAEGHRFPELAERVFRAGPDAAATRVADYLRNETARGRLRVDRPDVAARAFLEMIKGDLHTRALFSLTPMASTREIDRCARDAVRLFLDGCARPAGSSTIG